MGSSLRNDFGDQGTRVPKGFSQDGTTGSIEPFSSKIKKGDIIEVIEHGTPRTVKVTSICPHFMAIEDANKET